MNRNTRSRTRKALFVQYANPAAYPPVVHAAQLLARAGWRVRVLDPGSAETSAIKFPETEGIEVIALRYASPGWRQKIHYLRYALTALWSATTWRPDWIYGSDFLIAPVLWAAAPFARSGIVYHEHDTPYPTSNPSIFVRLCMAARRLAARRSSAVIFPNIRRAVDAEGDLGMISSLVVWNCPLREETEGPPCDQKSGLRLLYHGSINEVRVPFSLIQSLALLPTSVTMTIVGYETIHSRGHVDALWREATRLGVADRVEFLPAAGSNALRDLRRAHQVGVAVVTAGEEDLNLSRLSGASCKVFEYMASGLVPLLPGTADWQTEFIDAGLGVGCDPADPASVAGAIRWLHENTRAREQAGAAARARVANDWNYETQFAPVLALLAGATGSGNDDA